MSERLAKVGPATVILIPSETISSPPFVDVSNTISFATVIGSLTVQVVTLATAVIVRLLSVEIPVFPSASVIEAAGELPAPLTVTTCPTASAAPERPSITRVVDCVNAPLTVTDAAALASASKLPPAVPAEAVPDSNLRPFAAFPSSSVIAAVPSKIIPVIIPASPTPTICLALYADATGHGAVATFLLS